VSWGSNPSLVRAQVGATGQVMRSQKEITLREDLDARDRLDIYRNFLLYCMSGDVVALPMGSSSAPLPNARPPCPCACAHCPPPAYRPGSLASGASRQMRARMSPASAPLKLACPATRGCAAASCRRLRAVHSPRAEPAGRGTTPAGAAAAAAA